MVNKYNLSDKLTELYALAMVQIGIDLNRKKFELTFYVPEKYIDELSSYKETKLYSYKELPVVFTNDYISPTLKVTKRGVLNEN